MYKYLLAASLLCLSNQSHSQDLLEIFDLAWQHDPAIHEAEENRNAIQEARPQSLAKLLPTLAITGALNQSRYDTTQTYTSLQLGVQNFWDTSVYLRLSQPIYHHDYWAQLSQSENQLAQAEAEYASEQQNLLIRTAKAYFGVLSAQSNLEFAQTEKHSLEYQLKQMKQRLVVGTASITDLQEVQAGFDQINASEIDAQRKLEAAKSALAEIIGSTDVELNPLKDDFPLQTPNPNKLQDWLSLAEQNNPAVIAASNRAEVARKAVEIQFSGHLPTIDLVGNVGIADTNRPAGLVANSQAVGVQLNVPIFQGGAVNSKVRQAEHQFESAKQNIDKQRRAAERQTKDAYKGIVYLISQIEALKSAQQSTKIAVDATGKGLQVGTRTMAEVLTAIRNYARTQRDHSQARYEYILSSLSLKQAAGALTREDLETVNHWLH